MENLKNLIDEYREKLKIYRENVTHHGFIPTQEKYYRQDMEFLSLTIRGLELGIISEISRLARSGALQLPSEITSQSEFLRFALKIVEK